MDHERRFSGPVSFCTPTVAVFPTPGGPVPQGYQCQRSEVTIATLCLVGSIYICHLYIFSRIRIYVQARIHYKHLLLLWLYSDMIRME